jgi:hypothetical protein
LAVETLGLQQVHQLHPERNELGLHGRLRLENMEDGHAFQSKSSFGGRGRPGIPSMGATDEYGYIVELSHIQWFFETNAWPEKGQIEPPANALKQEKNLVKIQAKKIASR